MNWELVEHGSKWEEEPVRALMEKGVFGRRDDVKGRKPASEAGKVVVWGGSRKSKTARHIME
jgi:hypothetical protein